MQQSSFLKYGFRIRTRVGVTVDNLVIQGRDEAEARRKLLQMYRDCEVLDCVCQVDWGRGGSASYEEVLTLITR